MKLTWVPCSEPLTPAVQVLAGLMSFPREAVHGDGLLITAASGGPRGGAGLKSRSSRVSLGSGRPSS